MAETIPKKRTPKFKRTDFSKYSKLGVRRKKKQVYRRPKGIDNKINKKMKGHLRRVMIGFKNATKTSGLIQGLEPVKIIKPEDLKNITKGKIGIVGKVGMKRKIEIAETALEKNKRLFNLNAKKFLNNLKDTEKVKEEKKTKKEEKSKAKTKAMKEAEEKEAEAKKEEKKDEKEIVKEEVEKVEEGKESIPEAEKEIAKEIAEEKTETKKTETKKLDEKKTKSTKKDVQTNNYGRGK